MTTTHLRHRLARRSLAWTAAFLFAAMTCFGTPGVVAQTAPPAKPEAQGSAPPKLVVILVVDQMRVDYLTWYAANYSAGLARLVRDGAWFSEAAYPYLNTITCAGHSTIGTGSFPYRHGMILNNWFDPKTGKSPYCTDDATETEISYNGLSSVHGDSAKLLMQPAIGEQIMKTGGRSVALSFKPRSAITLTGHKSTAVVWFDERGGWTTSTAFTKAPVPFLKEFIDANPITADYDKVWDRSMPLSSYQGVDDGKGEGKVSGWSNVFPHPLAVPDGKVDAAFYARWQRTPFADEYLGRMAAAAIDSLELGKGEATDFLGVSFSSVDAVGHVYGPRSHEIQDLLYRLDRTIGVLLDHLDAKVGRGNYVLGLSADHGVSEIPDQIAGGRVSSKAVGSALEKVLEGALGAGPHVLSSVYTNIYVDEPSRKLLAKDKKLRAAALAALCSVEGVKYAYWTADLTSKGARESADATLRAAALSTYPGRSGDITIAPDEKWIMSTAVTTHGTQYAYDQRVPVIIFGNSVRPGKYPDPSSPADVTPTLAAIARIPIGKTDGRVLKSAVQVK